MNSPFLSLLAQLVLLALVIVAVSTAVFNTVTALRSSRLLKSHDALVGQLKRELAGCDRALDFLQAKVLIAKLDPVESEQFARLLARKGELTVALGLQPTGALAI